MGANKIPAAQLRALADELESGSGRVRFVCAVFCAEHGIPGVNPGPGMIRLSRQGANPAELADAMKQATALVGRNVIPVN